MGRLAHGTGHLRGARATRAFFEEWVSAFDEYEIEVQEVVDLGRGIVFAVVLQSGRPVGSAGRVQQRYASVVQWQHGVVARLTNYGDIDEARAAAKRLAAGAG